MINPQSVDPGAIEVGWEGTDYEVRHNGGVPFVWAYIADARVVYHMLTTQEQLEVLQRTPTDSEEVRQLLRLAVSLRSIGGWEFDQDLPLEERLDMLKGLPQPHLDALIFGYWAACKSAVRDGTKSE